MSITRDKLLPVTRDLLTALKHLLDVADVPRTAAVSKEAQAAIDRAEDLIGEEVLD